MEVDFSTLNSNDFTASAALLRSVLDHLGADLDVLKAIRKDNVIVDFEYILSTVDTQSETGATMPGKRLSRSTDDISRLFSSMVEVVETGTGFEAMATIDDTGSPRPIKQKFIRFRDGVLILKEDITEKKLAASTTPASGGNDNDGNSAILPLASDLPDSKKLRAQLREDAHFIEQIADTTPDIIYILDLNTFQVIYTNRQVAADLGYTREQIAAFKNPVLDLIHEDDRPAMMEHLKKMKTVRTDDKVLEIEYRMRNANGRVTWFCDRNTVFKRDQRGQPVEKLGFSQNITERKEQEERLLTGLDILCQAEEISGFGTWEYHIASGSFKWSKGMYRLFDLSEDVDPTPEIYFDYTGENQKEIITRMATRIRIEHQPFEETFTLITRGHQSKFIKSKAIAFRDKHNKPVKMIGVDLDITAQVKSAQEITELNKTLLLRNRDLQSMNTELRTFNRITANDYRETLQILYTNLEYIASKDARNLADSSRGNIRKAQGAIQKMKLLTEDINTYLGLYETDIDKTSVDPNRLVAHLLETMNPKLEQAMGQVTLDPLPELNADSRLFVQLMQHILDNALKFRKQGAAPNISITSTYMPNLNIPGTMDEQGYTVISVKDNGIGITEEETEKIFDLFYRVHPKSQYRGSGIGLAVCRKIMTMHGGFIKAESTSDAGTTISCFFHDNR
ncbi:MAG: PAS domain S-box protein [Chitinophagaceae bacterium]|nr:MAG: PAS domain S-box protein [Chitinophagaceae bacterium]